MPTYQDPSMQWHCKTLISALFVVSFSRQCFGGDDYTDSPAVAKLRIIEKNVDMQYNCKKDFDKLADCPVEPVVDFGDFDRVNAPPNTFLCFFQGVADEETGKIIMIAGDERVRHMYNLVVDEDVRYAHAFVIVSQENCTTFPTLNRPICSKLLNMLPEMITKYQPDILILNQRFDNVNAFSKPFNADDKADATVDVMSEVLQEYARTVKKIILLQPYPNLIPTYSNPTNDQNIALIDELLKRNETLESYHLNPFDVDTANAPGYNRLKEALNDCDVCVIVETLPLFLRETPDDPYAGKQYIMYNEDTVSYICDGDLSHAGVELYMNSLFHNFDSKNDIPLEDPAPYDSAPSLHLLTTSFIIILVNFIF